MNATQKQIEVNTYPADPARPMHGVAPFRLMSGRGIVDARGRVIATVRADSVMDAKGYAIRDRHNAFTPIEADDNAHGIAAALNIAHGMRDAIRAAVATIDACGSISETTLDMLRKYGDGGRLECARAESSSDEFRADGRELIDTGDGAQPYDVIRTQGEEWAAFAPPEWSARVVDALNGSHAMAEALREIRNLQAFAMTDARGMRGDNGAELERIISGALALHDNSARLECVPRDPNVSPRVGDELPLNAPRLSLPEPRGDGTQAGDGFALVILSQDLATLCAEFGDVLGNVADMAPADVTGALVRTDGGEYVEVWTTDSARPYDLRTARYVCIAAPDGDA